MDWALGFLASGAIAALAWRRGSLSPSGAWAALAVGVVIWASGGAPWFAVLLAFFATSTALARVGRAAKQVTKREFSKGDRRDAAQVLANGGVAALAALAHLLWKPWAGWSALFLGALATANSDTWATELGVLSRRDPISLVTLRRVPRGTSGAVSPLGLLATFAGALAVGLVAAARAGSFELSALAALLVSALAGTLGSLADSLLGATVQTRFYCDACAKQTEGALHHCGAVTRRTGGLRPFWGGDFGNDAVNLCATMVGALAALALRRLLAH